MDLNLTGKVALVTGGTRGLGWATAQRLAAEGCHVAVCSRSADALQQRVTELRGHGVRAHGVVADVSLAGDVERFVDDSAGVLGGVDLLVANVGGTAGGGLLESTAEDWQQTFELNLFHAVRAVRVAQPHMQRRGGGSVVVISSISGSKPGPRAQYGAAKAGEIFLAGALALELAPHRIRVNAVSPGSILFPEGGWERFRTQNPERFSEFERREFPWGRLGRAEEVADVVAFVLSERAAWINGPMSPSMAVRVGPARSEEYTVGVPLYMDTHERVRAITMDGVTRAYERSLEVQARHGARYVKMWVHQDDEDHGLLYCLIEAPSREAVVLVHLDAHGLLPNDIHEVVEAPQEIPPGHQLARPQRSVVHA